jgi:hypothetical protein
MRFVAERELARVVGGLAVLALLTVTAGRGSAQMLFDGNVLYLNNTSGTLAGQFIGTPPAFPGAGCPAGMSASVLGTTTYTHNVYADPLLPNAPYQTNVVPSFQPSAGSPVFNRALTVPAGFFQQTCYSGAIGPNPGDDWTAGWTYYDSTGANRQDLHLPGMPNPRPLKIYDGINLYSSQTWSADTNYEIRAQLRVKEQATLTIPAGVVVFEDQATLGKIIIERGGKIVAVGTAQAPIIITSNQTPGSQTRGSCGGIIINGWAKTSTVNSCVGDSAASEGGAIGYYGGNDDTDNSGQLKYVRVEFSGKEITPNNELNSFLFNACGSGTQLEYLEAFMGADDCMEFFGGVVDCKHFIGIDGTDDGFDTGGGYRGRAQFVIMRMSPRFAPSGTQNGDKGWEADNAEAPNPFTQTQCSGQANPRVANFTLIGDRRFDPPPPAPQVFPGPVAGINWRRMTAGMFINSIIYNFKTGALKIDDDVTWTTHCAATPPSPAVFCDPAVAAVPPVATGRVFVSHGAPNPFRNLVAITYSLPERGHAEIEIFTADGRHVATLVDGDESAGPHTMTWKVDPTTPSGVFFYRVFAGGARSSGKITRVN